MKFWKYFSVSHADLNILNPSSEAKLDALVNLLDLDSDARLLDIACGKGEFISRAIRHWQCTAVGIDLSPYFIADARKHVVQTGIADSVELLEQDGCTYEAEESSFDVASCLGASWIWGGYSGTLDALAKWTKPGGLVISGEPYWKKPPEPHQCEAMGVTAETYGTHEGNVQLALDKGLGALYTLVSSDDEWDHYQSAQWLAVERYARANRDDEDTADILKTSRVFRDQYLEWERDVLGWAIYVFMKDPVVI